MPNQDQITLKISTSEIEHYCEELCRGSSNVSRKHASLIALEGFITRHSSTDTFSGAFHNIINTIQHYSEQTRDQLLKEYAEDLATALSQKSTRELARIHESMSRNGYDLILERVTKRFSSAQQQATKIWVDEWCQDAESRALAASGFPDAFNFKDAGIALDEYRAMSELKRKLSPL
ncbi:MAG: hypothetical protein OQL27_08075 [Sedimenticola sp.]|nr:hypothetical protein [Sedimenticola sp.]